MAEEYQILSWNQMGARKQRSTLTAISLLNSCVQTAWKARPGCIVSMLSLDLAGAFDNVSHERLLWVLRQKGIPTWAVRFIASFLQDRHTRIAYPGYKSEWIQTQTGIPQGSPLSPILFLFFISELLETFQQEASDTLGFGFVDDTNLITWGNSAQDNCQRLTVAHERCLAWAKRYRAVFAPDKYQLIHFTRKKRHDRADLASTVRINDHPAKIQESSLRVLGVWVDPQLQWKDHIQMAIKKGTTAFDALSRITASTWGPSMRRSRLLYTAVVRPALLYGSQIWGQRHSGNSITKTALRPIQLQQKQCLRRITGAYKRTPTAAIEREAAMPPVDLYIKTTALQRASRTRNHPVEAAIRDAVSSIWKSLRRGRRDVGPRPETSQEVLLRQADERETEIQGFLASRQDIAEASLTPRQRGRRRARQGRTGPGGHQHRYKETTLISIWADLAWRQCWEKQASTQRASTWLTPWSTQMVPLYEGLTKAEATALVLLRTEVIGLNAWLAYAQVLDMLPRCPCGESAQTVRHVMLHCTRHDRIQLIQEAQTELLQPMLSQRDSARIATQWFLRQKLLTQFTTAQAIEIEDTTGFSSFPELYQWTS
jgi:hypothetical protein